MPRSMKHGQPVPGNAATPAALKVVLLYAIFAATWILFSDKAVSVVFRDPELITTVSTLKGWFFVAVTSLLLLVQLRRFALRSADRAEGRSDFGGTEAMAPGADPEQDLASGRPTG